MPPTRSTRPLEATEVPGRYKLGWSGRKSAFLCPLTAFRPLAAHVERASMLRGGARRGHHRRVTPAPRGGARRRGPLSREAKVEQGGTIGRAGDGPRTPRKRTRRSALPTLPLPVGLRRSRVPVIPFVPTVVFPAGVAVVRGHRNNRSFHVSDVSHMYDKNEGCETGEISHLSRSRRRACLSALERIAHRIPFSFSRARQNASMYCAAISSGGFVYRWMYRCERCPSRRSSS